ncbi:glycosyltransferase [Microbacterium sp. LRZ72]|uniref:glycosyltransferase n=1 Tax=Microbacterium sp. LRZ72 TaxID=2942481 RepID=UPI0029B7377D|nr:glycosyltransferase [Microbacterium sp. LRZ72]MDX2376587.1 glycosyltransferase [Microbacterium sp. LRZ72]
MRSLGTITAGTTRERATGDPTGARNADGILEVTLFCAELAADDTAAGAHVRGTLARLTDPRLHVNVVTQWANGPRWMPRLLRRPWRLASVVARARVRRPRGVLLARWSPFVALVSGRWRRRGLPLVLFVQGNLDDMYDSNPWTRRVPRITEWALASIREAAAVVTPSEGLAEWVGSLRADGRRGVTVIPNGADVGAFDAERERAGQEAPPSGTTPSEHALFFGNLASWQGVDTILAAVREPAWPADLDLHVIGDGQAAEAVRSCGDARVHYLGRRPKREVTRAAARARMTLATRHDVAASATGVSPFKIIESAAAGTPSIVTRVPGQTELAQAIGGSLLIPPGDPAALAAAVARLHGDAELRDALASAGRDGVRAFDWAAHAGTLAGIVLAAADGSPRRTRATERVA